MAFNPYFNNVLEVSSAVNQQSNNGSIVETFNITAGEKLGYTTVRLRNFTSDYFKNGAWVSHLNHPLTITLINPTGTKKCLLIGNKVIRPNKTDFTFEDAAIIGIADLSAPVSGVYTPIEPLSVFNSLTNDFIGTWSIEFKNMTDTAGLYPWRLTCLYEIVFYTLPSYLPGLTGPSIPYPYVAPKLDIINAKIVLKMHEHYAVSRVRIIHSDALVKLLKFPYIKTIDGTAIVPEHTDLVYDGTIQASSADFITINQL
jgi:hypothetical protein